MEFDNLLRDEHEMRYYQNFNATMFYESLESIFHEIMEETIEDLKVNIADGSADISKINNDLQADKVTLKDVIQTVISNIEPVIRNYLEIPKNVVIPIDENHIASQNLEALGVEVGSLQLKVKQHLIYTRLLRQRLKALKNAQKLSEHIDSTYIALSKKVMIKMQTLSQLASLVGAAKSGEDVSERLAALEEVVKSYGEYTEDPQDDHNLLEEHFEALRIMFDSGDGRNEEIAE